MKYLLAVVSVLAVIVAFLTDESECGAVADRRSRRPKRTAITFPKSTQLRITNDIIIPVLPLLNTTFTFLSFTLPLRFPVPSYSSMLTFYQNIGRMEENGIDLDHYFLEEHRANEDRRYVYKMAEDFFKR